GSRAIDEHRVARWWPWHTKYWNDRLVAEIVKQEAFIQMSPSDPGSHFEPAVTDKMIEPETPHMPPIRVGWRWSFTLFVSFGIGLGLAVLSYLDQVHWAPKRFQTQVLELRKRVDSRPAEVQGTMRRKTILKRLGTAD